MIDHRERNRAILLLLILIAIGGIVMYGTEKVPYAADKPRYEAR